ncbi:MAG: hypothetical protein R3233_09035 [Xanthomonadales bacterium]|nr:hypothetical protein [Xanthomonadales bacterium]
MRLTRCLVALPAATLATLLAGAGCAAPAPSAAHRGAAVTIEGITIRNDLAYPVTDVLIRVPATGAFAGCGNLLPRSECSNTFQGVDYRSNGVVVSWREHGKPQGTDEFVIEVPENWNGARAARVEVVIFAPGQAGARLAEP